MGILSLRWVLAVVTVLNACPASSAPPIEPIQVPTVALRGRSLLGDAKPGAGECFFKAFAEDRGTLWEAESWRHCIASDGAIPVYSESNVTADSIMECYQRFIILDLCPIHD